MNSLSVFFKKNSPIILTSLGVCGIISTIVSTIKSTSKAIEKINNFEESNKKPANVYEKIKISFPIYIPTILTCGATITCVVGSQILNKKQQASLLCAYSLLEKSFKDYKKTSTKLYGEDFDKNVKKQILIDKAESEYPKDDDFEENIELFYDFYSDIYFKSTLDNVLLAEYRMNEYLKRDGYVYLNDFYNLLGLDVEDNEECKDMLGWHHDELDGIIFDHETVICRPNRDDNVRKCIMLLYDDPILL